MLTRFHFHFKIFKGYTTFTLTIQHCWHWHLFQPQKLKALVNPQNSFVLGHSSQWGTTSEEDKEATLKRLIKLCRDLKSLLLDTHYTTVVSHHSDHSGEKHLRRTRRPTSAKRLATNNQHLLFWPKTFSNSKKQVILTWG